MRRGEKAATSSRVKEKAAKTQESLQANGLGKRESERRAWAEVNLKEAGGRTGTAGGRSKVSKRTIGRNTSASSTGKTKTAGKTRK